MSETDYSHLFADLAAIAPKVNAETDGASLVVNRVEKFLQDRAIGVRAEVRLVVERRSSRVNDETILAYERHAGRFRIVVKLVQRKTLADEDNRPSESLEILQVTPWNDVPRETKLETYPALPNLLKEISARAAQLAAAASKTTANTDALLASLEAATDAGPSIADPRFKFSVGQVVSTLRKMRYGLLDLCCAGRIVERDLRGEGGAVPHYRLGVQRDHWHLEDEVFRGDGATAEANRVNNSQGRLARAIAAAPKDLADLIEEIQEGASLPNPAFNLATALVRELRQSGSDGSKLGPLAEKAEHALGIIDAALEESEGKKAEAERKGLPTMFEAVGLPTPTAAQLQSMRRRLADVRANFSGLLKISGVRA